MTIDAERAAKALDAADNDIEALEAAIKAATGIGLDDVPGDDRQALRGAPPHC